MSKFVFLFYGQSEPTDDDDGGLAQWFDGIGSHIVDSGNPSALAVEVSGGTGVELTSAMGPGHGVLHRERRQPRRGREAPRRLPERRDPRVRGHAHVADAVPGAAVHMTTWTRTRRSCGIRCVDDKRHGDRGEYESARHGRPSDMVVFAREVETARIPRDRQRSLLFPGNVSTMGGWTTRRRWPRRSTRSGPRLKRLRARAGNDAHRSLGDDRHLEEHAVAARDRPAPAEPGVASSACARLPGSARRSRRSAGGRRPSGAPEAAARDGKDRRAADSPSRRHPGVEDHHLRYQDRAGSRRPTKGTSGCTCCPDACASCWGPRRGPRPG